MDGVDVIVVVSGDGTQRQPTFNEMGNAMLAIAEEQRNMTGYDSAAHDLSLCITHLEDALTRYNSAQYRKNRTWKRADPDKPPS